MTFDFPQLIAHAEDAPVGGRHDRRSGTMSNLDRSRGAACIAEKRMLETIDTGKPVTPFLRFGDRVRIEMRDADGNSIFGAIDQEVQRYSPPA